MFNNRDEEINNDNTFFKIGSLFENKEDKTLAQIVGFTKDNNVMVLLSKDIYNINSNVDYIINKSDLLTNWQKSNYIRISNSGKIYSKINLSLKLDTIDYFKKNNNNKRILKK